MFKKVKNVLELGSLDRESQPRAMEAVAGAV
jgi:hypothetical protein